MGGAVTVTDLGLDDSQLLESCSLAQIRDFLYSGILILCMSACLHAALTLNSEADSSGKPNQHVNMWKMKK